jgi:signal transduction histidine kinase/CheY-like chemotaxis protein
MGSEHEDDSLREAALRTADSILRVRQRAEEELQRAKEALEIGSKELATSLAMVSATLEATTDAIVATDSHRRITAYNKKYARLWNLDEQLLSSRDHAQVLQVISRQFHDPDGFLQRVEEVYASGDDEAVDVLELLDGRVLERSSRIQHVDGHNAGRVWSFRDITAQRSTEQALRDEARALDVLNRAGQLIASTLRLEEVLQAVTDAATEISGASFGAFFYNSKDDSGDVLQLYTLSGASRASFEGFGHPRPTDLFGPTFRGEDPIIIDDVLNDPRYGRWAPHHGIPPRHLPVRSYLAVPVKSRSGHTLGGLFFGHPRPGVFNDRALRMVTGVAAQAAIAIDNARLYEDAQRLAHEREGLIKSERAARVEVERTSQMKDDFLATLSHELRTPLTAMLGWAKVLAQRNATPEIVSKGLQAIERNAHAQAQLIEDLLDMSRIVSGKIRLDVQPTHVANVISQALEVVQPSAEAKGIRLSTILDPAAGPVMGDPNRLQQVVWNLLTNAIKFTPKGGKVTVLLTRVNSHIEIVVSDTGIGMDAHFVEYAFDRFRQADASTTRTWSGLGLGLSIVKQLVELHGGAVRAESEGEGKGATFIVSIPLASLRTVPAREHPMGRFQDASTAGMIDVSLEGIRVLVVDDEPDASELVKHVLEGAHAQVVTASNADQALATMQTTKLDVIVSDVGMPDKDGYQFIRDVRASPSEQMRLTPAVALTAFARSEDRTRAMLAGYQMHMAKPIEPNELVATVASLVRKTGPVSRA